MKEFRYVSRILDKEDFQYLIGKFNDDAGNSIKIFINETGTGLKYVIFDDIFCAKENIIFNADMLSAIDFDSASDSEIEELLRKLGE